MEICGEARLHIIQTRQELVVPLCKSNFYVARTARRKLERLWIKVLDRSERMPADFPEEFCSEKKSCSGNEAQPLH